MTNVILGDLPVERGRGKERDVWHQSQFCILALLPCWAVGSASLSKSTFPHQTTEDQPFLPPRVLIWAKEAESDSARAPCWLCWSWVSGKPSGLTISMRLEKPTYH